MARWYGTTMEMKAQALSSSECGGQWSRPEILFSAGEAKKLVHASFAVRDAESLDGLRARRPSKGLHLVLLMRRCFRRARLPWTIRTNTIYFGLAPSQSVRMLRGIRGPVQHLTLALAIPKPSRSLHRQAGFGLSDRVEKDGKLMTCFMRGNHEHHNLACFYQDREGVDHHSYEAGEWDTSRLVRSFCQPQHPPVLGSGPPRTGKQSIHFHRRSRPQLD